MKWNNCLWILLISVGTRLWAQSEPAPEASPAAAVVAEAATPSPTPVVPQALPSPTASATPAPTPVPMTLALPPRWDRPGLTGSFEGMQEFLSLIGGYTRPDPSLEIDRFPEICCGVTLMMPLKDAMQKLNIFSKIIPPKQAIAFPGIPFFYRPFSSPIVVNQDKFNLIYIVTDMQDRVVALQFVDESPAQNYFGAFGEGNHYYNFVNNRSKALKTLYVGAKTYNSTGSSLAMSLQALDKLKQEVDEATSRVEEGGKEPTLKNKAARYNKALDDSLLIRTELHQPSSQRAPEKTLEAVQFFVPRRIGDLLNYSMQKHLQSAQR